MPVFMYSQNTVGILDFTSADQYSDGYNLIYPHYQSDVFLLNSCGQIVHQWPGPEGFRNNNTCYLLENGDLIRTVRTDDGSAFIWEQTGDYLMECRSWENELKWSFSYLNDSSRMHHDIEPTPHGTVLVVSWDHHSIEEAISHGRDSTLFSQERFSPDKIIEYDPVLDSIIWEWKAWDHLIQDRDPSKPNYGAIQDNPSRIDINWDNNQNRADWMHVNSLDFNPVLDQIMINLPFFNEIWIIDHSTTTEEAKSSSGGNSGKGGDLLWRWGNPQTYQRGDDQDQQLFFQHDALWALDYLSESNDQFGSISIFNNRKELDRSYIGIIKPDYDPTTFQYTQFTDLTFLPEDFDYEWSHTEPNIIQSKNLSSVQILPNNNKLICSGRNGLSIELTPDEEIIWMYKSPYKDGIRVEQGTNLEYDDNFTFRIRRIPSSYSAFDNKDLEPIEYLEVDPDLTYCNQLLNTEQLELLPISFSLIDNSYLEIENTSNEIINSSLYNINGQKIKDYQISTGITKHQITTLHSGFYILHSNRFTPYTFIKI